MKNRSIILLILFSIVVLSCRNDYAVLDDINDSYAFNIPVKLTLRENDIPQSVLNKTQADDQIDNIYVFVFDENLKYINAIEVVNDSIEVFDSFLSERTVLVVANAKDLIESNQSNWTQNVTTADEIKNSLITQADPSQLMLEPFIAYREYVFLNGISSSSAITDNGASNGKSLQLKRIVGKIQLSLDNGISNYTIDSVKVINAPLNSYVLKEETLSDNLYNSQWQVANLPVYSFAADDSIALIAKMQSSNGPRYFKIPIFYIDNTTKLCGVKQNYFYNITITSIDGEGYGSELEAVNSASNIVSEVKVSEFDIRDINYSASKSVGVSNKFYYFYGDQYDTYRDAFQVYFSKDNDESNNDFLTGTNIEILSSSPNITIENSSDVLNALNHTAISVNVKFNNAIVSTSDTVRVSYGESYQDIVLEYHPMPAANNKNLTTIGISNALYGEIVSQNVAWGELGSKGDRILLSELVDPTPLTFKQIEAMFFRTEDFAGNTKVVAVLE